MQNGLFRVDEQKLIPHSPDIFTTNELPHKFDPNAKCPRFMQYLDEVFCNDKDTIHFAQEAVGYSFHKQMPTAAIFLLIGDGCNGKSIFNNILSALHGPENTCTLGLRQLGNEYYLMELLGKMINVSTESTTQRGVNTDLIKAMSSGDYVSARRPYEMPVKFRPYAKHYFAMNKAPSFDDSSYGMNRRLFVIEFPRTFGEDEIDTGLEDKLLTELPGIFNWALEGYFRLKDKEFKLIQPDSLKKRKADILYESNSVITFVKTMLTKTESNEDRIKYKDAYEIYNTYCFSNNIDNPEAKSSFKMMLKNLGLEVKKSSKDNNQLMVFGVKIIDNNLL